MICRPDFQPFFERSTRRKRRPESALTGMTLSQVLDKVEEEIDELREAISCGR